jgi:hypothetical protein
MPAQQAQQAIQEPIYTPIPTKTIILKTPTPTIKSAKTLAPKPAKKITPKRIIKPTPTPTKSFWSKLFGL